MWVPFLRPFPGSEAHTFSLWAENGAFWVGGVGVKYMLQKFVCFFCPLLPKTEKVQAVLHEGGGGNSGNSSMTQGHISWHLMPSEKLNSRLVEDGKADMQRRSPKRGARESAPESAQEGACEGARESARKKLSRAPWQAPSRALSKALSRAPRFGPALLQAPPRALFGVWGFEPL